MNAAAIAEKLAGYPVEPKGGNYLICCPAHDDATPSLSLRDSDDGKLLVCCFAGCSGRDVLAAIRAKVGEIGTVEAAPKAAKGSSEYERRQREKARWLWSHRRPIAGTIAEKYLRGRCITCPLPPTLGFLPARKPDQHPAMIAAFGLCDEPEPGVVAAPRNVVSVHLTLLKRDGSGKAEVEPDKLMIGSPCGKPIVVGPPNDLLGLAVCEGVEDTLTAHQATGLGAWAAGSAPHMAKLGDAVPGYVEAITIYAHADKAGQDGANGLAAKLRARGTEATIEGLCDE